MARELVAVRAACVRSRADAMRCPTLATMCASRVCALPMRAVALRMHNGRALSVARDVLNCSVRAFCPRYARYLFYDYGSTIVVYVVFAVRLRGTSNIQHVCR